MTPSTTPGTHARARTPIAAMIRRLAAMSALTLTVFGLSVATASAGESESIDTKGGLVAFNHENERFMAVDQLKDGLGVRAYLKTRSGGTSSVTDPRTDGFVEIPAAKDLSIRETTLVSLWMCYTKFGVDVKCSRAKTAVA